MGCLRSSVINWTTSYSLDGPKTFAMMRHRDWRESKDAAEKKNPNKFSDPIPEANLLFVNHTKWLRAEGDNGAMTATTLIWWLVVPFGHK